MRDMLVTIYHLESLPADEQDKMVEQIAGLIFEGVLIRVMPQMSEDQQKQLEALVTSQANPEQLVAFLSKEVPNFETILQEEAEQFHADSEAVMSQVGK